jgi:GTPase SAR1 family protein
MIQTLFQLGAEKILDKYMDSKKISKNMRLCVLGLDNAGKTTILRAMSEEEI